MGQSTLLMESFEKYDPLLRIETGPVISMLEGNLKRWQTHLDSERHQSSIAAKRKSERDISKGKQNRISGSGIENLLRTVEGELPFALRYVKRLPIVGDVHLGREEWPSTPQQWNQLWSIEPKPIKLSHIVYSVNRQERAFDAFSLRFVNQTFKSYDLVATDNSERLVCKVRIRSSIATIKIKQRNSLEGISMICGL